MEQRIRLDPEPVTPGLVGVVDGTRPLARKVPIQRAAERDVEDLDAATNAQHRQPALARRGDEGDLERVPRVVRILELRVRPGAVARRLDIPAAREHQPGEVGEDGGCAIRVERRRHDKRHEAGARERVDVRRVEGDALPAMVRAPRRRHRHDPAHRLGAASAADGPSSGQRGLLTPAQSTRTPNRGMLRSVPVTAPSGGRLRGASGSYRRTP